MIEAKKNHWNKTNLFWILSVHLVALASLPTFSWENFSLVLIGVFILAPIGINIGYHRMLSHKAFDAKPWVRYSLATVGALLGTGGPLHWSAMHRVHHRFSDTSKDPHDSTKGFWYSHVLHLFVVDDVEVNENYVEKYVPDLAREPYLRFLEKYWLWGAISTLFVLYMLGGFAYVLWGGFVRIVCMWHVMWFVNSASHLWGYRNYDSKDHTYNCWWVGLLAAGEGWHNNHHAYPACAAHGHKWWEFDFSYKIIQVLEMFNLVSDVKKPPSFQK